MGNFICAVVILAFIVIFTGVNSIIVCDICDDMIDLIDAGKADEASRLWKEKQMYVSLFVRDAEIDVVSAEAEKNKEKTPFEDGEAEAAIMSLREAIMELKNSEYFNWQSIL